MCCQARDKTARADLHDKARFTAGDSEFLPFADQTFDFVTCANSFHHYPHQDRVVCEVHRLLRPGGRFVLIDGFRDNVVGWVAFDVIISHVEGRVHHAPWSTIDGYFRDAGFRNIRRRKINFWLPLCITIGDA
jgi:ubiquinone/menaquinone biosynthesis C-methylase UbiE